MAGLMQLLLDTVDAGIDDANYQKIQSLKVNEILLNQTNSVIDKEKNSQNQDLVDAISNERHANAAKVNKELGRDFLIDFDSNAFIKKVNGQIIGKIKEFGNFSSEVVADLYTKSVLELTMQIANGGIDTIERIASNSNQGVSEIVATSFNIAKNTPSFYKYENNTEILNGIKSDALVTGVLIAGYASLTKEEKDRLWEKAFDLTPEQTIQLYEAEVADNPYQDYPGKTEEEKQFTKANTTQFMVSGLVRAYIKYKGGTITKENFDGEDCKKFVRSQMSLDPNLINDIFSSDLINFDEEFSRIYESNSTPADDRNRFQNMEIIQVIKHYESAGKIQIDENGKVVFLDSELEKMFSSRITDWNNTLSLEEIHNSEDLDYHYTQYIDSLRPYMGNSKDNSKDGLDAETKAYSDTNKVDHARNISDIKQKSFFAKIQESTPLSNEEISLALSDFIEFVQSNEGEVLEFLADSTTLDILYEKIESLDEEFFKEHPHFKSVVDAIGIDSVTKNFSDPEKRKEWLEELSKMDPNKALGPTITEQEARPALEARKEDMFVAPIPVKEFISQEGSFNGKQIESSVNSFENSSEDTSSNNSTDSSAPKLEEINTSMVVSNTAMKATTRTGFWSNFMRHMREDKESKGFFGKIRSAFRKAREDSDKANGFAVEEESTSTSESSGSTEELTEQEAFTKSLQVDTSKSTPIAPQPDKSTTDTKQQDSQDNTKETEDPTI